MFNLFKNKQENAPTNYKLLYFNEPGTNPFAQLDFEKNTVYQVSDFNLKNYDDWGNIHKELSTFPFYFELWVIPTVLNTKLLRRNMLNKLEDITNHNTKAYYDLLFESLPKGEFNTKSLFLIIDKEKSEIIKKEFEKLSLILRNLNSDEANSLIR